MPKSTKNEITLEVSVGSESPGKMAVVYEFTGNMPLSKRVTEDPGSINDTTMVAEFNPPSKDAIQSFLNEAAGMVPDKALEIAGAVSGESFRLIGTDDPIVPRPFKSPTTMGTVVSGSGPKSESFSFTPFQLPVTEKGEIIENLSGPRATVASYAEGWQGGEASDGPDVDIELPPEAFIEEFVVPTPSEDLSFGSIDFPTNLSPDSIPSKLRVPVQNTSNFGIPVQVSAFGKTQYINVPAGSSGVASISVPDLQPGDSGQIDITAGIQTMEPVISRSIRYSVPDPAANLGLKEPELVGDVPQPGGTLGVEVPVENTGDADAEAVVELFGGRKTKTVPAGSTERFQFQTVPRSPGEVNVTPTLTSPDLDVRQTTSRSFDIPSVEDSGDSDVGVQFPGSGGTKFSIENVRAPSNAQTGERFEVGLTVKNTGDEKGTVVVRVGDKGEEEYYKERSYTLSPQGTATFTKVQRRTKADTYSYTFTVTNEESGNSTNRTVVVPVVPSSPAQPEGGTLATRSFYAGNAQYTSRVILRVQSAKVKGDRALVKAEVENSPRGEGFFPQIEVTATGGGGTDSSGTFSPGLNSTRTVELKLPKTGTVDVTMSLVGTDKSVTATVPVSPPAPPTFEILGVEFPDVVDIAEEYVGKITVKNVGAQAGDAAVTGPGIDATKNISAGGSKTFKTTLVNDSPRQRYLSYTVKNVSEGSQLQVRRTVGTEVMNLVLKSLSLPDSADPGESFNVEAIISNTGGADGEFAIVSGDTRKTGTVKPESEQTVKFSRTLQGYTPLTVPVELVNVRTGRVVEQRSPTVQPNVPSFSIKSISVPDSVPYGKTVNVDAVIENVGGSAGEFTASIEDVSRSGSLDSGQNTTVSFPVGVGFTTPRTFNLTLSNDSIGRQASSERVEVAPSTPSFTITNVDYPQSASPGDALKIDVGVQNEGAGDGEAVVTVGDKRISRRVPSGGTDTFTFTLTKSESPVDVLRASVAWEPVGKMDSRRLRVEGTAPDLTLASVDAPSEMTRGQQYTLQARVANEGDAPADVTATFAGKSRSAVIQPGSSQTFRIQMVKGPGAVDKVPITVMVKGYPERDISRTVRVGATGKNKPKEPKPPESPRQPPQQPAPGEGDEVPGFVEDFFDFIDGILPGDQK